MSSYCISVLKKRVNLSDAFEGHQANDIAPSRHGSNDCLPSGPLLCSSNKLFLNSLQSINSYSLLPDQSFLSTQCVDESPALSNNLFIDDDQVQKSDCHFISNDTTGLIKDTVDPTPSYVNTSTSSCSQIQPTTDNIVTDQHRELTPLQPGECRELLMLPEVHQNNLSSVEKTVNADECAASTLSIAKKLVCYVLCFCILLYRLILLSFLPKHQYSQHVTSFSGTPSLIRCSFPIIMKPGS